MALLRGDDQALFVLLIDTHILIGVFENDPIRADCSVRQPEEGDPIEIVPAGRGRMTIGRQNEIDASFDRLRRLRLQGSQPRTRAVHDDRTSAPLTGD